jgi:hypothetical protein
VITLLRHITMRVPRCINDAKLQWLRNHIPVLQDFGPWKITLSRTVVTVVFYIACVYIMSGKNVACVHCFFSSHSKRRF